MAVPYSEIYNLFLTDMKDYNINKMSINDNVNNTRILYDYLFAFLIKGLVNFVNCEYDLEDRDDNLMIFNSNLGTDEKVILAKLMTIEWLTQQINDINQMSLYLQDQDFNTHAEAQNLKEKNNHLDKLRENVDFQMKKYGYKKLDWKKM